MRQRRAWDVLDRHESVAADTGAEAMPGAIELITHSIESRGWPVAILTRNSRRAALATLKKLGIELGAKVDTR